MKKGLHSKRGNIVFFFLAVLICLQAGPAKEAEKSALVKAPDFTLKTIKGKNFRLSANLGKGPVIINFWATWCVPCAGEMKQLKKLHKKFADDSVRILSISVDDTKTAGKVEGFIRARKYPCTVLMDMNKKVYNLLHVSNVPHLFLLDKEGNIVYSHAGYRKGDEKKLEEHLSGLLSRE